MRTRQQVNNKQGAEAKGEKVLQLHSGQHGPASGSKMHNIYFRANKTICCSVCVYGSYDKVNEALQATGVNLKCVVCELGNGNVMERRL